MIIVLMGVTGSGKTTIGTLLAERMGFIFADGDDFHPEANKVKMAAGHPLDDNDRLAWLEALNRLLVGWFGESENGVLACSALKESYRQMLHKGILEGAITFCWLDGSKEMIATRLAHRHHEYMNPKLLDSQIATLERPAEGDAWRVVNDRPPDEVVAEILSELPGAKSAPSEQQSSVRTSAEATPSSRGAK